MRFGKDDFLEYNATHEILICRQCRYAIQKSALDSHLLSHKIYRSERRRLLAIAAGLALREPDRVEPPAPYSPVVNGLAVLSGYKCAVEGCSHLTVSSKRMRRHWASDHGSALGQPGPAHVVHLQTFFRGNKTKYFEVSEETHRPVEISKITSRQSISSDHLPRTNDDVEDAAASSDTSAHSSPRSLDLDISRFEYFDHLDETAASLPQAVGDICPRRGWQSRAIPPALKCKGLIFGLLAISACHLTFIATDAASRERHWSHQKRFSGEFRREQDRAGRTDRTQLDDDGSSVETHIRQVACLLDLAQRAVSDHSRRNRPTETKPLYGWWLTLLEVNPIRTVKEDGNAEEDALRGKSPPAAVLDRVRKLPMRIAQALGKTDDLESVDATMTAVKELTEYCYVSFACEESSAVLLGAVGWLSAVPKRFSDMLASGHPAAVVVTANWAMILVERAADCGCWYLKGVAEEIWQGALEQSPVLVNSMSPC